MAVIKDKNVKVNPWYFTIEVGKGSERKRIKRRGFKRKQDATEAERALLNELGQGLNLDASKTLYRDFMQDFLRDKKARVKQGTLDTYTALIKNHILPTLGDLQLGSITPRHIQNLYNDIIESGRLSGENLQKVHTLINESLKKAAGWDMIIKNPAAVVDRPIATLKEMLYWTDTESHMFLEAAKVDPLYCAFLLAITAGMRQGEILGLRIQDSDTKNRTISVRQILNHNGKDIEPGAKSASGIRAIGIDKVTAAELGELGHRVKERKMLNRDIYEDNDLLICTELGTPVSPRNLNRSFYRIIKKINVAITKRIENGEQVELLKKIRFHDLRHTHVVMLLKMNENSKRIAERMGWSSIKMLDRYSHITPHMQQETAEAFGEMFFAAPNGTSKEVNSL
ncbi:site-specific integrase [Paenibacillus sp. IHBB 10380]|uniref:site-specific integrase n=1 Tax=Paenibacillus sp. IHBB 10380 TaxID=1566358 RepID=UPI0005CFC1CA|nr:site-specific integrase [Paenibacillus sp. IHBB 10380]